MPMPQSFMPRDVVTFLVPGTRTKDAQAVTRWQETNLDIWANLEVIVTKSSIKYPLRLISNSKVPDEGSRLVS